MERFTAEVVERDQRTRVVAVSGDLDLAASATLWDLVEPLLAADGVVVLDGTGLDFLDSSGLRVLLQSHRIATERGADFRLVAPQPAVQRVLELAGASGRLAEHATVAAAVGAVSETDGA